MIVMHLHALNMNASHTNTKRFRLIKNNFYYERRVSHTLKIHYLCGQICIPRISDCDVPYRIFQIWKPINQLHLRLQPSDDLAEQSRI